MNDKVTALVSLLSKCNPNDTELTHESKVMRILCSNDYKELSCRTAFSKQFQAHFSEEKIRAASNQQLADIESALPLIQPCFENILFSIQNGAGPLLTKADAPDFMSKQKMSALCEKLKTSSGKNYTNIEPDDFMDIFDENTVKSATDIFLGLPSDIKDYDTALSELFKGKKYCISEAEIDRLEREYQESVRQIKDSVAKTKHGKSRRRLIKLLIGLWLLFIPSFAAGLTGAISAGMVGVCTIIELFLVIIFWIKG